MLENTALIDYNINVDIFELHTDSIIIKNETGRKAIFMQQAVYGVFKNGEVILNEPINIHEETDVVVVFLKAKKKNHKNSLMDIFSIIGAWEDNKNADEIIDEIRNSRINNRDEVVL